MHTTSQEQIDRSHLRLLAIFHIVLGGFSTLGIGFLVLHYWIMTSVFANPQWTAHPGAVPPAEVLAMLELFYWAVGCLIAIQAVLTLASGWFLWQRKHRVFSMVVAALNCLNVPLGTVLGVFTLVVLLRESVQMAYGDS